MAADLNVFLRKASNRELPGFTTADGEGQWKGPFTFIQAADCQFGLIEKFVEKRPPPWGWAEETRLTELAVQRVNSMSPRPRFMIVCGDLVDAMPGNADREAQEKEFFRIFRALAPDIPLVCVCGNHDVGDVPTTESVRSYTKVFGDDYFSFWVGGVKCLVLNSQFYQDASQCPELKEAQDAWLDRELAVQETEKSWQHLVVFQHIPWFLAQPEEENQYFNIEKDSRLKMLQKLCRAGVCTIFCGHYHQNAGAWFEEDGKRMELVVTSAIGAQIGQDKSGLRLVTVTENAMRHKYLELESWDAS